VKELELQIENSVLKSLYRQNLGKVLIDNKKQAIAYHSFIFFTCFQKKSSMLTRATYRREKTKI